MPRILPKTLSLAGGGLLFFFALATVAGWTVPGFPEGRWGTIARVGLPIFLGAFFVVSLAVGLWRRWEGRALLWAWSRATWWMCRWVGMVAGLSLAGGMIGCALFSLAALVFSFDRSFASLAFQGFRDGAFYVFIWAPGLAFILCVMEAHGPERTA
ncbi:MAG: hypothetical protein JJT96_05085 [Opitutales bacterium]|nr:hypothetical protein [Opitutales bacterium]